MFTHAPTTDFADIYQKTLSAKFHQNNFKRTFSDEILFWKLLVQEAVFKGKNFDLLCKYCKCLKNMQQTSNACYFLHVYVKFFLHQHKFTMSSLLQI